MSQAFGDKKSIPGREFRSNPLLIAYDKDLIVARDGSGNFSAGTVTVAQLTGTTNVKGNTLSSGVQTITSGTSGSPTAGVVLYNHSQAGYTLNLPAASSTSGGFFMVKNIHATGTITIDPNASETVDGATTYTLSAQYDAIMLASDGSNWFIVA